MLAIGGFALVQASGALGGGGRLLGRLAGAGGRRHRALEQGLGDLDRALAGLYRTARAQSGRLRARALVAWATGGLEIYLVLSCSGPRRPSVPR